MIRIAALSLPLLMMASACAPGPDMAMSNGTERACFMSDRIINFRAGQSPSLYVKALGGDVFELQSTGYCRDMDSAVSLGFTPLTGSSERTCVGDPIDINVSVAGASSNRCRARVVRKLSEEEVAALPSRYRP
ncbi:MAG: hypothetical protein Q8S53_12250 [Brevundimonas sp.]|uniref:hypothetical protein n=1 Tax=Brevundimonas sp. TaxID=1871086 RepID=UPI002736DD9D|nr:hypothetical protein [Brevundimonas sp.]MDP3379125.1 hypothetical protein [Brevundimonas sp.]